MPQATNIVIKDAAAVDRTFELISPAAGDGAWANWRYKRGNFPVLFPIIAIKAYRNSASTARKVDVKLRVPAGMVDTTTGLPVVHGSWDFAGTVTVPDTFGVDQRPDVAAFAKNLFAHALLTAILQDASSAT